MLALGLFIFLQYAIAWRSVRSPRFQSFIKAEPTLLVHRGRFLEGAMRVQRITREEVLAAVRNSRPGEAGDGSTLANVEPHDSDARAPGLART